MAKKQFTPTEELILEVLVARTRLGEGLWTFEGRNAVALSSLEEKGYIRTMHGVTENTIRAVLTKMATAEFLSPNYRPPIIKQVKSSLLSQLEEMCLDGGNFITHRQIVKLRKAVEES
jgi:hypothetical protein